MYTVWALTHFSVQYWRRSFNMLDIAHDIALNTCYSVKTVLVVLLTPSLLFCEHSSSNMWTSSLPLYEYYSCYSVKTVLVVLLTPSLLFCEHSSSNMWTSSVPLYEFYSCYSVNTILFILSTLWMNVNIWNLINTMYMTELNTFPGEQCVCYIVALEQ
jgi:hypothetical protein